MESVVNWVGRGGNGHCGHGLYATLTLVSLLRKPRHHAVNVFR